MLALLRMLDNMSTMTLDTAELSSQMRLLQEQLRQSLRIYHHRIASKTRAHTTSDAKPRHGSRADLSASAARFAS